MRAETQNHIDAIQKTLALLGQRMDLEMAPHRLEEFDALISKELEAARTLVVVWTPASVDSRWVRGEARDAAGRRLLRGVFKVHRHTTRRVTLCALRLNLRLTFRNVLSNNFLKKQPFILRSMPKNRQKQKI